MRETTEELKVPLSFIEHKFNFAEYEEAAHATAVYPLGLRIPYCALGITGEAGELANKVKKTLRGDKSLACATDEMIDELGDVLWYVAEMARNLGVNLETVAKRNIQKLADRKKRNMVRGEGDHR